MSASCGSCGAAIDWAKTERGAPMPINLPPDLSGNLAVSRNPDTGELHVRVLKDGEQRDSPRELGGTSHWATCPNAQQHRRKR